MLKIKDLKVGVEGNVILDGINMEFEKGKNYALLGKNGSGKSTFALSLFKKPGYEIIEGDISLDGKSLQDSTTEEISKYGIFLAFQEIPEIEGVKVLDFLRAVYNAHQTEEEQLTFLAFKKKIVSMMEEMGIPKDFLFRELNVGFSGGEKRKLEMLQMKMLQPAYVILDEVDSGLDINSVKKLGEELKSMDDKERTFIVISHNFLLFDYLQMEKVYVMEEGKVKKTGNSELIDQIKENGF